jgi:predicted lipoprotein with Yx(FWY)xxD motif
MSRIHSAAALAAAGALGLAACGGGSASSSGGYGGRGAGASPPPAKQSPTSKTAIRASNSGLGRILVDAQGRTVYLFRKDAGTKSACTGACATAWPPVLSAGAPAAGSGINASLLGTTVRSDGQRQVTYNGHPLYLFAGDQAPGDTNGEGSTGFGAPWLALSPAGSGISA